MDCLGTLLELEPPAPRLVAELGARGFEIDERRAIAAFGAEIDHYLRHHLEGADASGLAALRDDCARVLRESLGLPGAHQEVVRAAMLDALRFRPYPDVASALGALRRAGVGVVVASNWDCSLAETLARAGIRDLVDGVVTSAEAGAAKPAPAVLRSALALAGEHADDAVAMGDSVEHDVVAARAAGMAAVLVRRRVGARAPEGVAEVASLGEGASLVLTPR